MRGKEARSSALGRVELLLDSGEVQQSWDVGLGNWSVGSSPKCGISIAGDISIAPQHLVLTVGKRYTLLKAHHPIGVEGKIVREWLIDRTTIVEIGSRKLRVYPVGFSSSELAHVSVVTQERISEVASKLATIQSPARPPVSSQSTVAAESSLAESSDLKKQLDEMQSVLEEMQARISSVSDSEALERRIQSLTDRSIAAIEENLGQQMRQPLREEIADLLQQERRGWELELQHRLDSLEVQVRQTSSQVDESLENARQDIRQIKQRFQELVMERDSSNWISAERRSRTGPDSEGEERGQNASSLSNDSHDVSDSYPQRSEPAEASYAEPPDMQEYRDFGSAAFDSDFQDRNLSPYNSAHPQNREQDQEPNEATLSDADEVLEFQVDDESISLRLNRMLGEQVERRPPTEQPKAEGSVINDYNSISVASASAGIAAVPDESSALSGRYLLELNHIPDPASDAKSSSPDTKGTLDRGLGGTTARSTGLDYSDGDHSADEASIEEYMQRLLDRVRSGPSSASASGVPAESPKNVASSPRAGLRNATTGGTALSAGSRVSGRGAGGVRTATKPAPEVKSDLQALRELANSNARRAINRSVVRRSSSRGLAKSIIAGTALLSGVALLFIEVEDAKIKFGGIALFMIIAIVWGFDTFKDFYCMLLNRDKEDQDEAQESGPPAKSTGIKGRQNEGNT
jgi:hypothetical protein